MLSSLTVDCWDGPDNNPIIYHGHTLTSKIRFYDVIKCIREHAFAASEYPVILSIEQHCDIPQQQVMDRQFKEVFGGKERGGGREGDVLDPSLLADMLVTVPVDSNSSTLPSPGQLKHKVIIKHKKLTLGEEGETTLDMPAPAPSVNEPTEGTDIASFMMDLSNSIKNGYLFMQDPIDKVSWT